MLQHPLIITLPFPLRAHTHVVYSAERQNNHNTPRYMITIYNVTEIVSVYFGMKKRINKK